jgi:hypothetical protein
MKFNKLARMLGASLITIGAYTVFLIVYILTLNLIMQ